MSHALDLLWATVADRAASGDPETSYTARLMARGIGRIAQKVNGTLQTYASQNGFTLTLDVSSQQSPILQADTRTDITLAVVQAYNTASGVPAQPQGASAPAGPAPRTTPPRATTPRPATPRQ